MSRAERAVLRALAFGPMRQAGIRDSSGYTINTIKASLHRLTEASLVRRSQTKLAGRHEYQLAETPLARHYRDACLREYELLAPQKASRTPTAAADRIDQMAATLGVLRGTAR